MAHTPHGNEPWRVDPYDGDYNPDADKDTNGKDYGTGDWYILILVPLFVGALAVAMMTVGPDKMPPMMFVGAFLALAWVGLFVSAVMGGTTIGALDYRGMLRLLHIVLLGVAVVLLGIASVWFFKTY